MPKPRKQQVSVEATPYYHCVSRCVRRAFLCGTDTSTGESYEHRRGWLENKLLELPHTFAIKIAAYAIMSNHYHVVLYVDSEASKSWSNNDVIERWHSLFKGNLLSQRFMRGDELNKADLARLQIYITEWRSRLTDISWFMRVLNESIAREANLEDDCTGRFWEGRFKSQALLDEAALAACMTYVDLNPVRAGMAETPEHSAHTSVKARAARAKSAQAANHIYQQPKELLPFAGNPRQEMPQGIAMKLTDYLELVDATGRIIRDDKRGYIPENSAKIQDRLGLDVDRWLNMTQTFENKFSTFAGNEEKLRSVCERMNYRRPPGLNRCKTAFG